MTSPHRPATGRRAARSTRAALAALLVLVAAALALAGPALAADGSGPVAASVVEPLGAEGAVVVPYRELVGAADARNLNAAVVDTSSYWVAAVDGQGRVIASSIPRPRAGQDFARSTAPGAAAAGGAATKGLPGAFDLAARLRADGVAVLGPAEAASDSGSGMSGLMRFLVLPLGLALVAAIIVGGMLLIRGRNPGGRGLGGRGGAAGHGKIRKSAQVEPPATRFADVAGCDEAVEELREIVVFLEDPERFRRVGARMPRGVVLHGPPGTGKTLLAKAVAGESGVPFFALSGSDFVDTYVGVGAARVRDLFAQARKSEAGAIIFFDEIDAIGRARGAGQSGADSEREGTLNQLLGPRRQRQGGRPPGGRGQGDVRDRRAGEVVRGAVVLGLGKAGRERPQVVGHGSTLAGRGAWHDPHRCPPSRPTSCSPPPVASAAGSTRAGPSSAG